MSRFLIVSLFALLTACGGGDSDTDVGQNNSVIGDGSAPVVEKAEYACYEDMNGGKFFYFRISVIDEQGADTVSANGAAVLFKDASGSPIDWDEDGTPDPDVFLDLVCFLDSDPRECEGSLLESNLTGACDGTSLTFEGWGIDADGNESERVENFEINAGIVPAG
jgi:hypothetical protein